MMVNKFYRDSRIKWITKVEYFKYKKVKTLHEDSYIRKNLYKVHFQISVIQQVHRIKNINLDGKIGMKSNNLKENISTFIKNIYIFNFMR